MAGSLIFMHLIPYQTLFLWRSSIELLRNHYLEFCSAKNYNYVYFNFCVCWSFDLLSFNFKLYLYFFYSLLFLLVVDCAKVISILRHVTFDVCKKAQLLAHLIIWFFQNLLWKAWGFKCVISGLFMSIKNKTFYMRNCLERVNFKYAFSLFYCLDSILMSRSVAPSFSMA